MGYYKIPEAPGLVRDSFSKALLATDKRKLRAALQARQSATQVSRLSDEINTLKQELEGIKLLVKEIASGRTTDFTKD